MKKSLFVVALAVLMIFSARAWAVELTYAGSVTILEGVMKEAAPVFENKTGIKVGLGGGGSGAGIKATLSGTVDIGGVSRDLKEEELKQGLVPYEIGLGAVGLVVNKGVPIDNLTAKQVKELLTGKIKNWKAVGGPDLPVKVVISTPGCACREEFQEMVMDKEPYVEGAAVSPMKTLSDTVKNTPGGVGPLATAVIDPGKVKVIKIDGIAPTPENVKNKKYKASRPINLITKGPATGKAKEFIDFMLSPEGQALVAKNFVKIK
ncbi:MAG TPA: phosphate ABC transporter substrate-binding protein [Thermodesulfovibrionales bacterium]|nr:phosphate ABC transporter substrate-binding protein [Thermodesulfovibrionales bacterium]